jgi:hypothetical protein
VSAVLRLGKRPQKAGAEFRFAMRCERLLKRNDDFVACRADLQEADLLFSGNCGRKPLER